MAADIIFGLNNAPKKAPAINITIRSALSAIPTPQGIPSTSARALT